MVDGDLYIKKCFEFDAQCSSRYSLKNSNMVSRICNTFVNAINVEKSARLPRYIAVILDDDLISYLDFKKEGVATLLGSWVEWLVQEFTKVLNDRYAFLPEKCRRFKPFFYWVAAPTHTCFSKERNNLRVKFNLSLDSVIRGKDNMRIVRIKDAWNNTDSTLVVKDRISENGATAYWAAIDASLKFNIMKRELFHAKTLIQQNGNKGNISLPHGQDRSGGPTNPSQPNEPMQGFFRRHRDFNGEWRMVVREDNRRHTDNRF